MSVVAEFTIFPIGKGEGVSGQVKKAVKIIGESGLPYKIGPMGTSMEGEWKEIMDVIGRCFEELKRKNDRLYMVINADYRKGVSGRMGIKVRKVEG